MGDTYRLWRKEDPVGIYDLSAFERALFAKLGQEDYNYIYQLKLFLTEATEHIAVELVPLYTRIVLAKSPDDILDLTTHIRLVVRFAALQKIDLLEGRPIRVEKIILNPPRWPDRAWNAPRGRLRGIPGDG
jgi:hypothetical protein